MAHLKIAPPDICKLNPQVPATFAYILGKMLAKKPKDRYQTPKELLKDLENPERIARPVQARTGGRRWRTWPGLNQQTLRARPLRAQGAATDDLEEADEAAPVQDLPKKKKKRARKAQVDEPDEDDQTEEQDEHGGGMMKYPWWVFTSAGAGLLLILFIIWQVIKA